MRLQDKAEAKINAIKRYQTLLENNWINGDMPALAATLRLINKATKEIEDIIKQQLFDNLGV